jgi:hypothetical protein
MKAMMEEIPPNKKWQDIQQQFGGITGKYKDGMLENVSCPFFFFFFTFFSSLLVFFVSYSLIHILRNSSLQSFRRQLKIIGPSQSCTTS